LDNIVLGSGILSVPQALQLSGFYVGLVLLIFVCLMCDYVCTQLIKMAKIKKVDGFEKLSEITFGKWLFYVICICCFFFSFGALMGYSELIIDITRQVLKDLGVMDKKKFYINFGRGFCCFVCCVCFSVCLP